jgi:tripartite-type tricarboxylate transporter receptor subunit TctC
MKLLVALCLAALSLTANAQSYPTRAVKMVVPFAPAGATDILARMLSTELGSQLGQSFVVENLSGGGGNIGSVAVARAAPDGYTLLFGAAGNITINPGLFTNMPYDPATDLAPVSLMATTMNAMVVHPSVQATNVKEMIALAKGKPGAMSYASAGNGSTMQLSAEMFKKLAGVDLVAVHYRGAGPAMLDLLAGRTQVMFDNMPSVLPRIQAGQLRVLGVTGKTRSELLPNAPTIAEAGLPEFEALSWFGVFAPAKTPQPIIEQLNRSIREVMKKPDAIERVRKMGADVAVNSPEEFRKLIRADTEKWASIIKWGNIKAD